MTTISMSMSQLRKNLADALDQASGGNPVIVTRRGGTDAALVNLDLLEDILSASNPRIIKKISQARKKNELVSLEEAFGEL